MRVGIISPNPQPEIGGGFTYTDTLADAASGFEFGHDIIHLDFNDFTDQYEQEQERENELQRAEQRERERQREEERLREEEQERERAKFSSKLILLLKRFGGWFGVGEGNRDSSSLATPVSPTATSDAESRPRRTFDEFITDRIRAEKLDLLWLSSPTSLFRIDIPYAVTVWDLAHRLFPFFPEVSTQGWLWDEREAYYRTLLPRATYVFVGNEVGARQVQNCYNLPGERIRIIPLPTPNMSGPLSSDPLPTLRPFFFYPAQFWAHKNHIHAIKALKIARDNYNLDVDLVFTGSDQGNEQHIRHMVSQEGLAEHVHFMGFVPRSYIKLLYTRAEALLYLSFFGPDNLPPLEAFSVRCPVIISDHPGHREQLEDAALFVDPLDASAIAEVMFKLITDKPLRGRLLDRGQGIAEAGNGLSYLTAVRSVFSEFAKFRMCWPTDEPSPSVPLEDQIEANNVAN